MRAVLLAASILFAAMQPGSATETKSNPFRAEISASRHVTDNALDDPLAVSDWYTLLRGALSGDFDHDLGRTTLTLDGELRRFDTFTIENDAAIGLQGKTTLRLTPDTEIQASAFLRHTREGDAFVIDDLALGTRTDKTVGGASILVGLRLTPALISTSELSGFRERAGDTRFEDDLIPALRLEPDRDRIALSQGLTQTFDGGRTLGIRANGERTTVSGLFEETVALDRIRLRGEASRQHSSGIAIAFAGGAEWLRASYDFVEIIRPSIEASIIAPVGGVELRGAIRTGFDSDDTDDLLVSWFRRGEAELLIPLAETLALKAGLFVERRDNLVIAYDEDRRGLYGEIGWKAGERVTMLFRVDYREQDAPDIGFSKSRLEASIGVRTQL
ncbi:hypothetical protein [Aliihoeflea sp. PC F10.4]